MEYCTIIGTRCRQGQEIKGSPGTRVAEYFQLDVAHRSVQGDGHYV